MNKSHVIHSVILVLKTLANEFDNISSKLRASVFGSVLTPKPRSIYQKLCLNKILKQKPLQHHQPNVRFYAL